MRKLTLTNHVQSDTTVLENEFIDHYMAEANGEYVKVYLILLRHLNEPSGTLHRNRLLLLFSRHRQLQMYPVLSSTALVKSSKNFFLLQSSTLARRCPILT